MHTAEIHSRRVEQSYQEKECNREIGIEYIVYTLGVYEKEAQSYQGIENRPKNSPCNEIVRNVGYVGKAAQKWDPILSPIPWRDEVRGNCKSRQKAGKHSCPESILALHLFLSFIVQQIQAYIPSAIFSLILDLLNFRIYEVPLSLYSLAVYGNGKNSSA